MPDGIPLAVDLFGTLENQDAGQFGAQFSVGYDTFGLTDGNPLDSFYIDEVHSFATIKFGIAADVALDLFVVAAGVGGGISGDIDLAMKDPSAATDGMKLRDTQLQADLDQGPTGMFAISGEIDAFLNAFIKIGYSAFSIVKNFDIASITLLSFDNSGTPPVLAENTGTNGSLLMLNMGPDSGMRGNGATDGNDKFLISHVSTQPDGTETVNVSSGGYTQMYSGVREIYGEAGAGDNKVTIRQGVISALVLYSGYTPSDNPGGISTNKCVVNDQGSGPVTFYASDGNDQIHVSTGSIATSPGVHIYAGAGNDVIEVDGNLATNGESFIYGGTGKSTLIGGPGNDYIQAGAGDSIINPGGGHNTLVGGTGNDHFVVGISDAASNVIQGNPNPPPGVIDTLEIDGTGG